MTSLKHTTVSVHSDPLEDMSAVLVFMAQVEASHDFMYVAVSVQPQHANPNCDGNCAPEDDVAYVVTVTGPIRPPKSDTRLNQGAMQ